MLDCFRTGGANSPETFVTAIAATLARYPDQVIYDVTDPTSGLPAKLDWMPTIKEVHDACERAYDPIRRQVEQERQTAAQMAERIALEDARAQPRLTLDELKTRYGENWGMKSLDGPAQKSNFRAPSKEDLTAHYREYGLEFKPKETAE